MLTITPTRRSAVFATLLIAAACVDAPQSTAPVVHSAKAARSSSAPETFYGVQRFTRSTGKPQTVTVSIPTTGFGAPFTLHVENSGVSSGAVSLDGVDLLTPGTINNSGHTTHSVVMGTTGTLSVTLNGKPGSYLDIWIEGVRLATLFCPLGGPGAYLTLNAAVAATPVDGTIEVCDGTHVVDEQTINKPLTLRSQNPGGATILDNDPAPVGQQGRPSIYVNSIASGLVRIVDLNFRARGRSIVLAGRLPAATVDIAQGNLFDQVEIDSSTFFGFGLTTSFGVVVRGSSVPSARVTVSNVTMTSLNIGVFPSAAVETNVRNSVFDQMRTNGVNYGSDATNGSFGSVTDNAFTNCGSQGCVAISSRGPMYVARNSMSRVAATTPSSGIVFQVLNPVGGGGQSILEDNVITGAFLGGAANNPSNYSFGAGINILVQAPSLPAVSIVVRRNLVTTVGRGIIVSGNVTATDNVFTGGATGVFTGSLGIQAFNRNDVSGFAQSYVVQAPASANITCNWWGSVTGPVGVLPAQQPLSIPFALSPIANTANTCP